MGVAKEALAFALAFVLLMLSLKVFIGETDIWGPYYYRHAEKTYAIGSTLYYDDLSYLGRDFTYPPAYFMFAAQVSSLAQAPSSDAMRFPTHMLVMLFSIFTTYLLFENFEWRGRLLASLMLVAYTFYFITNTSITLHALSFGLLNSSVILFRRKDGGAGVLGTAALGLSFATHPLSLLAFPLYAYATGGFSLDLKKALVFGIGAIVLSLPLYLPLFLKSGLPNEIVPPQWGYIHSFGMEGMYLDMLFLLPMMLLAIVFGLAHKDFLNPLILLAFFLATAFVSFRANIFLGVFLAGFFPKVFEQELKDKRFLSLSLLAVFLNIAIVPLIYSGITDWCSWGAANDMCIAPMQYIAKHTPTEGRVAADPEFGHLEAYYGRRPVLSDLYVEYADERKYTAEAIFYYTLDTAPLTPYNVSILQLDDKWGVIRHLNNTDRVYDNGYVHIFRRVP